jgi:hypothetical protein
VKAAALMLNEKALLELVDRSIEAQLTWDKREVGAVRYLGPTVAIRNLNLSQVVALLIERKRRLNSRGNVAAVEKMLRDHGYEWEPWSPPAEEPFRSKAMGTANP